MLISKKTESCRLSIAATKFGFTEGTSFTGRLDRRLWESNSFPSEMAPGQWCLPAVASTGASHTPALCRLHLLPEYWTALRKRRQERKSMAQTLKEVLYQSGACCSRANPQSPSWPQHETVHSGSSAEDLSFSERNQQQNTSQQKSQQHSNIPCPYAPVCASPSPLVRSAPPPPGTLSLPIRSEQPLLSGSSPDASLSCEGACPNSKHRQQQRVRGR